MSGDYWMGVIIGYCCGTAITFLMIWFGAGLNLGREELRNQNIYK